MPTFSARRVSGSLPRPPPKARARNPAFDVNAFLDSADLRRNIRTFEARETIFAQGEPANSVYYIQEGAVKLTVVSGSGKEGVLAVLGPTDFAGEGCLVGGPVCLSTATAVAPTTLLLIDKTEMVRLLHEEHELSDRFIAYVLARHTRIEADLIDQLFNSSEKRLARTLLLLAHFGAEKEQPPKAIPAISQEMLSEMIGTTRSRVNFFMNKFRKLGFVEYNGKFIRINHSLLSVVLHD
jgi:CRP/FNR family transcriptional regulator, cyclic AMP receptor protein